MLKFCEKCESILDRKTGLCSKCNDLSQISKKETTEKIGTLSVDSFPFELNQRYPQKIIRRVLDCHPQYGINFSEKYNFFVLIRNAHKLIPNQSNVYLDRFDPETGLYYYVGRGTTGDQKLTGSNLALANSKKNNQDVHLFWERIHGSDHHYIGLVEVENMHQEEQLDVEGDKRKVFVFTLKPKNE